MQLDPILRPLGAALSRGRMEIIVVTKVRSFGAIQRKKRWSNAQKLSRTRLKPCSPWVIINTASLARLRDCQNHVRARWQNVTRQQRSANGPRSESPETKDNGMKVLPTSSELSALDPRNVELLVGMQHGLTHASTIPDRA